jgi:hypothetical protein
MICGGLSLFSQDYIIIHTELDVTLSDLQQAEGFMDSRPLRERLCWRTVRRAVVRGRKKLESRLACIENGSELTLPNVTSETSVFPQPRGHVP